MREENAQTKHEADRSLTNSIYTSINATMLQEIQQIHLRMSYGSKIDALARHILWLRQHDPGAKSIVFSQYKRFLHMLSMAFSKFGIGFSSADTKNGIRKFREDPTVCDRRFCLRLPLTLALTRIPGGMLPSSCQSTFVGSEPRQCYARVLLRASDQYSG